MASLWNDMLGCSIRYWAFDEHTKTRSIEAGKGPAVILLHSMWAHAEFWTKTIIPLAGRFHVYAIDMIGHGLTQAKTENYDLSSFLNHLKAFMDGADIDRADLVGNSLGGWVASWMAISEPDRVRKLVNVCGASLKPNDQPFADESGLKQALDTGVAAITNPTPERFEAFYKGFAHNPDALSPTLNELAATTSRLYQRSALQDAALKMVSQLTFRNLETSETSPTRLRDALTVERLQSIKSPTCFIWSDFNPTMPAHVAVEAHRLVKGSSFHLIKDCGHWPHLEKPTEFNRALINFLCN